MFIITITTNQNYVFWQGRAVKAGMMIARGQLLLMADADGATRVSDLGKLEAALKEMTDPGKALHQSWCRRYIMVTPYDVVQHVTLYV